MSFFIPKNPNNTSDKNNPLRFFDDFLPNGFDLLYNRFYNYEVTMDIPSDDYPNDKISVYYIVEYSKDDGFIVVENSGFFRDDNTSKQFTVYLKDKIQQLLDEESCSSIKYTNEAIMQKDSVDAQKTLIHTLLSRTAYFIENNLHQICDKKYLHQCQTALVKYIREIEQYYPDYISNKQTTYSKYLKPKTTSSTQSLKMVSRKYNNLDGLLDMLKDEGFLEKSLSLELFQKAFDVSDIETPLNIKWIKMSYKKCYYTAALELVQLLEKKEYIAGYSYKQLSRIFVQSDNTPIPENGWKEANYRKERRKRGKNSILDDISRIVNNF